MSLCRSSSVTSSPASSMSEVVEPRVPLLLPGQGATGFRIWHEGQLRVVPWGCRRGESKILPPTGWARLGTVRAGAWAEWSAESVEIPAVLGFDGGVWFAIRQGIRGILVRDEKDRPHVYPVCEPASHYYEVMTRSEWMAVLVREDAGSLRVNARAYPSLTLLAANAIRRLSISSANSTPHPPAASNTISRSRS